MGGKHDTAERQRRQAAALQIARALIHVFMAASKPGDL